VTAGDHVSGTSRQRKDGGARIDRRERADLRRKAGSPRSKVQASAFRYESGAQKLMLRVVLTSQNGLYPIAALRECLNAIGSPASDCLNGKRRIGAADRRKNRSVADPEIGDVPASAVGVDDTVGRDAAHPGGTAEVTGIVILGPESLASTARNACV
jgi:hypothetical protein